MNPPDRDSVALTIDALFRREYGALLARLVRKVGVRHLDLIEDAVQTALGAALSAWTVGGLPQDPGAWLYRAACNQLVSALRKEGGRSRLLERSAEDLSLQADEESVDARYANELRDELLRMLFVCADDSVPRESRLVLALKTLCGFSTAEIALRLFTSEANVHKRLQRARQALRDGQADASFTLSPQELPARLGSVQEMLYLLFNEGYLSSHSDEALRRELCEEAVRLTTLLAEHASCASPSTFALLALMHLHSARFEARTDASGGLLLLEEQDRRLWDQERIARGLDWLRRSASGDAFSRYHAEAGIAAEHCLAHSFAETRWAEIASLYEMLERRAPSPLHRLNRAVAVAEWRGPREALDLLFEAPVPSWLQGSYLWHAVVADLQARTGNTAEAAEHRARAFSSAPTAAVRAALSRRLRG